MERAAEQARAVAAAAGREPGSLLLRGGQVVNTFTAEVYPADLLLAGPLIAAAGPPGSLDGAARKTLELDGAYVLPGLIDGHLHLESALVTPREYARAVVPRGVTAVVADPHEIANVLGTRGIEYMLHATAGLPLEVFFTASSCVPASPLETAGAALDPAAIAGLLAHPRMVGVAELMNFPGVVAGHQPELAKAALAEAAGKVCDGHAPLLAGRELCAYAAAGVQSDHECSSAAEALEKLRLGLHIMIREGSAARNLAALLPLVTPATAHRFSLVTDDRHPHDLVQEGGVDHAVRRAVALGLPAPLAVQLASLNTARYFRLPRRGAVAPGYQADLWICDDLQRLTARQVFKDGRLVAMDGRLLADPPAYTDATVHGTVRLPELTAERLALPHGGGPVRVIGALPDQIITRALTVEPTVRDGQAVADPDRDLVKLAVIERHGRGGGVGVGLLQGLGLRRGALASTVAHDSHNLVVAGVDDADMLTAARAVAAAGGGFAAVAGGQVRALLPLPVAGLMSPEPLDQVMARLQELEQAAGALGVSLPSPFMALSFLALTVIPELKLSDQGLVDVMSARLVPLAAG